MRKHRGLVRDEDGVTMVEYALLVALISVALLTALSQLGITITGNFQKIIDAL